MSTPLKQMFFSLQCLTLTYLSYHLLPPIQCTQHVVSRMWNIMSY